MGKRVCKKREGVRVNMTTFLSAIIILGLLIVFHELGHFTAAKLTGIKVLEFSIGMGPAIFKIQKGETLYSLRALPIGGYVKMEGEDKNSEDERAFVNKPLWARMVVVVAGAIMNFVLAFLIFIIMMIIVPAIPLPVIEELSPGMPAQEAGLVSGDKIVMLDGNKVRIQKDVSYFLDKNQGEVIKVTVVREGAKLAFDVTPRYNEEYKRYLLGYTPKVVKPGFTQIISNAYYETAFLSKAIIVSFKDLITGKVDLGQVSGPVGIVGAIGGAAKAGFEYLLFFAALISINLGIFNLLPIPALDGSRLMFLAIEGIRRKPIDPEKEGMVHMIGLALLMLLLIFVTFNDVSKLFSR